MYRKWQSSIFLLILTCTFITPFHSFATDLYVAVNGNDSWSGRLPSPNKSKTDGPFVTIHHARIAVRTLSRAKPINVYIRGGTYFLTEPIVFTPEDSGSSQTPITYTAYRNEHPVISGGRLIKGWIIANNGRWEVSLPDVKDGKWSFLQLFVNHQRRYRPRLPKSGYFSITAELPPTPANEKVGCDRFGVEPGSVRTDWHNLGDVEILPFHIWGMGRYHIASLDNDVVTLSGHSPTPDSWGKFPKGNRYLIENVYEALDTPGQWYLDREEGKLIYLPLMKETPVRTDVIAPYLEQLLILKGDPANKKWVENIRFRGLTFAHTNWNIPAGGQSGSRTLTFVFDGQDFPQAEANLSAAIQLTGSHNCVLDNCKITHTGGYGLELASGCQYNRINHCELTDLGAGGMKIGSMGFTRDDNQITRNNRVSHCLIAHGGRLHPAGIGVWLGQSPNNQIDHNSIFDFYYTGISVGWTWGYGDSLSYGNVISYNHIYNIGQGILSDMGGIYTVGARSGTLLDHNLIHNVDSFSYGGWGIYYDEGSTGVVSTNNIVYDTKSAGFHQHYGKENVVRNNIFAYGHEAQIMRTRAEEHLSFTLDHNIIVAGDMPILGSNWSGKNYKLDYNLYWGKLPVQMNGMTWEGWQASGQDAHSIIGDPGFQSLKKRDFWLKPDSPALKLGFVPIDITSAGCGW